MVYLDLDELPRLVGPDRLVGDSKYASCAFLRNDHLHEYDQPLASDVREAVRQRTGTFPTGPIRLLTQLRYCGFYFSPLNLYYVYDEGDERVDYVLAEVSNTPWNERHAYVLWEGNRGGNEGDMRFAHAKQFHVSPFMGLDMQYRWRLSEPDFDLKVRLANMEGSCQLFEASMLLRRRELSRPQLRLMCLRYPVMTVQIVAAIYYQAWRLWWKQCPFYPHPELQEKSKTPTALSPGPHAKRAASAG